MRITLLLFVPALALFGCRTTDSSDVQSTGLEQEVDTGGGSDLEIASNASPDEIAEYVRNTLNVPATGELGLEEVETATVITAAWNKLPSQSPPRYTRAQLAQAFAYVRDHRFQKDVDGNIRRLSWLFPDDGCYTRAELAAGLIMKDLDLPAPAKIFSFGDKKSAGAPSINTIGSSLTALTKNHSSGSVSWWYHVAAVVDVEGTTYVLDAAIDPTGPMTKDQWLAAQTAKGGHVGASVICDRNAYAPGSACVGGEVQSQAASSKQFGTFLPREWNRMIQLNRNARNTLLQESLIAP